LDVSRLSVTVTDGSHAPVPIEFGLDQNILGHPCFALQWQVDVWRVSAPGMPIDWAPGTYTLAVSGLVDQADPMAPLELDPQGTAPFTGGTFTVQGPDKPQPDLEGALLHPPPESCPAPPPAPVPDMAAPPDAGAIPDGGENG
ncbi:MAG TPA: hypothetical protein VKW77_05535, partial [Acidimicrobiales bacterium]|nr:hypothetical protein [Acidimicrobiales bacterium]